MELEESMENNRPIRPVLVGEESRLKNLVTHLSDLKRIALDTESNSFYAYQERLCLLQISSEDGDYLIDPMRGLDLTPLVALLENPKTEKIFHTAESDIRIIKRELHCGISPIFDVMVAARFLGIKECGLSSLLQNYFGVTLNKKFQRANWADRPLNEELIHYAAMDTHYLAGLREKLGLELERRGLWHEVLEEFERISHIEPEPRLFDPNGFFKISGARNLHGRGLAVLRELYLARESTSKATDRPPFKILSNDLMIRLALNPSAAVRELGSIRGVTPYILHRHGHWIREAVRVGLSAQEVVRSVRGVEMKQRYEPLKKRFNLLKAWRRDRAQGKGVEPDVILPGTVLNRIASANPSTEEELLRIKGMGPLRLKSYAREILNVLHLCAKELR